MLTENPNKCLEKAPHFKYDEACLDIINLGNEFVEVFGQYSECEGCNFQNLTSLVANQSTSILVNTKYALQLYYVANNNNTKLCSWDKTLLEHYRYGWNITEGKCCVPYIKDPADNAYLPILSAFIILFFFGTIWYMIKCIYKCTVNRNYWRRFMFWTSEVETDLGSTQEGTPLIIVRHPNRMKSIDVFRGLCIIVMIFVNYGGGQYWFFKHSVWNGLTFADMVFPWFLWIMGLSFYISLHNKLRRAVPRRHLVFQVIRRSFLLVLLGLMVNSHGGDIAKLDSLRLPGVLQRIGLTYLIVGLLETAFAKRTVGITEYGRFSMVQDLISAWPQWIVVTIMLIVHTSVTFAVDVPGCGRGYLGPGGLQDGGKHYNCTGGVAGYVDRTVFGEHMYKHPTCEKVYETDVYFDPEGILGILTSTFLVYLGVQAGRILKSYTNVKAKTTRWLIWGFVTCLLGGILCKFSKNDGFIPINKNLWSLSFVLVLGGLAFCIQAFLFVVVDITRKWGGRPCFYPGMNPLTIYVGSELLKGTFPFGWKPQNETHGAYLAMNLWGTTLWVAIGIFLYKKNIFLSL